MIDDLVERRTRGQPIARGPLWGHALALAVILFAMLPVVGTSASFTSDEGAYIFEAQSLSDDGSWTMSHPLPAADPTGEAFPLALARETDDGWVAVGKHPVYSVLLAAADRVGGVDAMVVLSVLGTLGSALGAAYLARRLEPKLTLPVLWLVGVGSPLLFDGYWVMAHTLATAACVAVVILALRARQSTTFVTLLGVGVVAAAGVVLRREALLFMGAVALVFVVQGLGGRHRSGIVIGGVAGGAALGALVAERIWYRAIVPAASTTPDVPVTASGTLGGRLDGFVITWLQPGYAPFETRHLLLILMALLGVALVAFARMRPTESGFLVLLTGAIVAVATIVVAAWSFGPVPGLLVACPAVLYGIAALRRPSGEVALGLWIVGIFAVGVAATQYDRGGALEWGGRYFALAIPIAIPVLLVGLRTVVVALDGQGRIAVVGALVVSSLTMSLLAIGTLREGHRGHDAVVSTAADLAAETPPGDGGGPVVVAADFDLGRLTWKVADQTRWLYADDLDALASGLRDAGIEQFVLVANDRDGSAAREAGLVVVSDAGGGRVQQVTFPGQ